MNYRRVVAAVASCALLPAITIVGGRPAFASTSIVAQAAIGVSYPSTTTFNVCPYGTVDDGGTGQWVFELDGIRADGTVIHVEATGFGATFSSCYLISTQGTPEGGFAATLSFARVGSPIDTNRDSSEPLPEAVALAGLEAHWTPQQNANAFSI